MAIEFGGGALSKKVKISKAQQTILVSVGVASVMIGVTVVVAINFIKYIGFNGKVITAKDEAISGYSKAISSSGACQKPRADNGIYTSAELKKCDPNSINAEDVPGTLRYSVFVDLAKDKNLESVARESESCTKTYDELLSEFQNAMIIEEREKLLEDIKTCSALRAVPDALPANKNVESLLASLNQLFLISGWMPETLAPAGSSTVPEDEVRDLLDIPVRLSIETRNDSTIRVLNTIEKSIREFNITMASIEWAEDELSGESKLNVEAQAKAYYIEGAGLVETEKEINASKMAKKGN